MRAYIISFLDTTSMIKICQVDSEMDNLIMSLQLFQDVIDEVITSIVKWLGKEFSNHGTLSQSDCLEFLEFLNDEETANNAHIFERIDRLYYFDIEGEISWNDILTQSEFMLDINRGTDHFKSRIKYINERMHANNYQYNPLNFKPKEALKFLYAKFCKEDEYCKGEYVVSGKIVHGREKIDAYW